MDAAYQIVVSKLVDHLGVDPDTIRPETTFQELDLDSLSLLELALVLQDETGLDLNNLVGADTSVGRVADEVRDALKASNVTANR